MEQIFKFWTYFKWNNFLNSEQISNGTKFQILNKFQMEIFFKFWTDYKNNPNQYNVHNKANKYMGRPTKESLRASVCSRHNGR
jgi:hypothetical protein